MVKKNIQRLTRKQEREADEVRKMVDEMDGNGPSVKNPNYPHYAQYICYEGSEGVGKTTQVGLMVAHLKSLGKKVLETKEPGTAHSPLTMVLRKMILDKTYEEPNTGHVLLVKDLGEVLESREYVDHMTATGEKWITEALMDVHANGKMTTNAREYITQAIRHIHLASVVLPAMTKYDYIIQDRGILSGLAYGTASGVNLKFMVDKNNISVKEATLSRDYKECYDKVIYLQGNVAAGLKRAQAAKQEFAAGDVMESRGTSFLDKVNDNFVKFSKDFNHVSTVQVDGKSREEVFAEILALVGVNE